MFYLIITILVADYVIGRLLSILNASYEKLPVPAQIADIYSEERHRQQTQYARANRQLSWLVNTFSLVLMLSLLCFGGFRWLDIEVHQATASISSTLLKGIVQAIAFFMTIDILESVLSLPFDIYQTFSIEQRFGFNTTTPKLFVADWFKSIGLQTVFSVVILSAVVLVYTAIPDWFWLVAWLVVTLFSVGLSYFYSQLIVPLFNKQTRLEDGELRDAIARFAQQAHFRVSDIYVMDSSKRTTRANAYFTGWGRNKRIVLYDTLIEQLTTDEIVAVLAHEIGHNKRHHTLWSMLLKVLMSLLMFVLLGLVLRYDLLSSAIGCENSFHVNLFLFYILYSPVNMLLSLLTNYLSRRHEYQADEFAKQNQQAPQLVSALKKMSAASLNNPCPHPAFVFFNYSHPTLVDRIIHLQS